MERRAELKRQYKDTIRPMGVLQIVNKVNGKIFIDSSTNLDGLMNRHRFQLKMGAHMSEELLKDWKELGEENFTIEPLELFEPAGGTFADWTDEVKALEKKWLEKLQPYGEKGYHKRSGV